MLSDEQRRRLEKEKDSLQQEWDIRNDRLMRIRKTLAIETDPSSQFKYEQQIQHEQNENKRLNDRLDEIEKQLYLSPFVLANAIFLDNIIESPSGEGVQRSTVWLSITGQFTYIVDSITIKHCAGPCLSSMGSGAMLPDANYKFEFSYNSQKTHALIPALVLSHENPRPIYFTLGLAPTGEFYSVGGNIIVSLHYRTLSGLRGTLLLQEPPKSAKCLAKLLERDIEVQVFSRVFSEGENPVMIVTPKEIQRGLNENEDVESRLIYRPFDLPYSFLNNSFLYEDDPLIQLLNPIAKIQLTPERLALNRTIEQKGVLPEILKWLERGDFFAFDICAGILKSECEEAIFRVGESEIGDFTSLAIEALTIRHYLEPSESLSNFILKIRESRDHFDYYSSSAVCALVFYPVGKWFQALLKPKPENYSKVSLIEALYVRREILTDTECQITEDLCWKELNKFLNCKDSYPVKLISKYLIWRGYSITEILERFGASR